jgi:regulator of sirC expression with transglutaminase-like and TPR domain
MPVALAILYLHAAQALSWPAIGIDFPVRFLVRLEAAGERVILDPFEGGRTLAARDLRQMLTAEAGSAAAFTFADLVETDARAVLLKLQREAKVRLVEEERFQNAAETAETIALLDPADPVPWRDMGFLFAHAGETKRAVEALVKYLKRESDRAKAAEAEALLGTLRRQLI